MKTYRIFFRGSVDIESERKPKKSTIERCIPAGAVFSNINTVDADGETHAIDCRGKHCRHYDCPSDADAEWFCSQCCDEEED